MLHEGDGLKSAHATGGEMGGSRRADRKFAAGMNAQDVLHAWRDSSAVFFAGALLCPKVPFRRFLTRESYRVEAGKNRAHGGGDAAHDQRSRRIPIGISSTPIHPDICARCIAATASRCPWGNIAQVTDPCPKWAVFRMLNENRGPDRGSQISVLRDGDQSLLYCCHSRRANDMAGNPHVLSVGIDLVPALHSHGVDAENIVASITDECLHHHGETRIPKAAAEAIKGAARVLNIAWIEDALPNPARIICPRSTHCPRTEHCDGARASRAREITDVREEIVSKVKRGR